MKHLITHMPDDETSILWAADIVDRIEQASLVLIHEMIPDQQFLLAVLPEIKISRPVFSDEEMTILGELYDIGRTTITVRVEVRCGDELILKTKMVQIQVDEQWKSFQSIRTFMKPIQTRVGLFELGDARAGQ